MLFLLATLAVLTTTLTALPSPSNTLAPRTDDCETNHFAPRGSTPKTYYARFEAVPNGTVLSRRAGLLWSGFQTTTSQYGIIPSNCNFIGPDRETKCHYAVAAHARDLDPLRLPTLQPASPATLMKLNWFSWAAGPQAYFGPFETVRVLGYDRLAGGGLKYSGRYAEFDYTTAAAGGTGAPMFNVSMPADFVFAAYRFNITTPGEEQPVIFLDDVNIVTYTPVGAGGAPPEKREALVGSGGWGNDRAGKPPSSSSDTSLSKRDALVGSGGWGNDRSGKSSSDASGAELVGSGGWGNDRSSTPS